MAVKVTTKGTDDNYVGLEVCGGPRVIRLLITWPYERSAEVVEIPLDEVESVAEVEPHQFGEIPDTVESSS